MVHVNDRKERCSLIFGKCCAAHSINAGFIFLLSRPWRVLSIILGDGSLLIVSVCVGRMPFLA